MTTPVTGAPVLAGYTLPQVSADGYSEQPAFRGGFTEMASGVMAIDLLSTLPKYSFSLTWTGISRAQAATILTAYGALMVAAGTFVSPFGVSYTVQPDSQQALEMRHYAVAGGVVVDVSITLREV